MADTSITLEQIAENNAAFSDERANVVAKNAVSSKGVRLDYSESAMPHAMTLEGVNLDALA